MRGRFVTWEQFALGRIRRGNPLTGERTVNAQVELRPNGDFVTRSNAVECAYCRIDPSDWDGDGWHNAAVPSLSRSPRLFSSLTQSVKSVVITVP